MVLEFVLFADFISFRCLTLSVNGKNLSDCWLSN